MGPQKQKQQSELALGPAQERQPLIQINLQAAEVPGGPQRSVDSAKSAAAKSPRRTSSLRAFDYSALVLPRSQQELGLTLEPPTSDSSRVLSPDRWPLEGRPLSAKLKPTERIERVAAYLQEHGILFNKKGGLKTLPKKGWTQELQQMEAVFYHFPYQALTVLFRLVPAKGGTQQVEQKQLFDVKARQTVLKWLEKYPQTKDEVRQWAGNILHPRGEEGREPGARAVAAALRLNSFLQSQRPTAPVHYLTPEEAKPRFIDLLNSLK